MATTQVQYELEEIRPASTSPRADCDGFNEHYDEDAALNQPQQVAKHVVWKLVAVNWAMFVAGMNDGSTGALIPSIRTAYDADLLFVAIVYLVNFSGWLIAAFTNAHITAWLGMGGVLVVSATSQVVAYSLNFWEPPYPVFCLSFLFSGFAIAYMDAQANTFVASLDDSHRWLGILHSVYGLGALVSPLAATALASETPHWHYYYAVLLGCAASNIALLAWTFRAEIRDRPRASKSGADKQLKSALSQRSVWILSLFFFLYVGAEVTAGGWVVEFLISVRNGSPSQVGYVASGFWGGLALGRLLLADVTHKFGERRMVFLYIVLGLVMQLLFWFVPNIVANAVVISLLGFAIAPLFPAGISVLTRLLPRDLHVASIGLTATIGQAGSAAFPFLTGAVASKAGVTVLQPIMVALLGGMFVLWALMPRVKKQTE